LPAAVALEPATALMEATLLVAYVSVHWTAAGSLPAGEFNDKFRAIVLPGAAVPDDSVNVSWPNATPLTTARIRAKKKLRLRGLSRLFLRASVRNWSTSRKSHHMHPAKGPVAYAAACRLANSKIFTKSFVFNAIFGESSTLSMVLTALLTKVRTGKSWMAGFTPISGGGVYG